MLTALALYVALGVVAGILAGLLGIGGGLIIVPMINFALSVQGIHTEYNHHIALGTSLTTIIFTSVSSFLAHHKRGSVLWPVVFMLSAGVVVGTFGGVQLTKNVDGRYLQMFFIVFLIYMGTQMFLNVKPKPSRGLPGLGPNTFVGLVIGFVSSLVGIGGGSLTVPYLTWCNVPMIKAIGTSAAVGFFIAVAGAAGSLSAGWGLPGLPEWSFGFVYGPALLGIAGASICTAPLGVKMANSLPVERLKRFFAIFLYVMAAQMLYKLLT